MLFFICYRSRNDASIWIGLLYPFLLILACTTLSTINRKIPTGFNETKFIGKKSRTDLFFKPLC